MSAGTLFGASACLYSGTSYGRKVEGAPAMVRAFDIVDETSRSYVLRGGSKVPKKTMVFNTGSFEIAMFHSLEEAISHLKT